MISCLSCKRCRRDRSIVSGQVYVAGGEWEDTSGQVVSWLVMVQKFKVQKVSEREKRKGGPPPLTGPDLDSAASKAVAGLRAGGSGAK